MTARQQPARKPTQFKVVPAAAPLGAEVEGIDLKTLDDATFKALHEAWLHHVLLVFRDQSLAAEDLVNLVHRFGTPVTSSNLHKRNLDERAANALVQPAARSHGGVQREGPGQDDRHTGRRRSRVALGFLVQGTAHRRAHAGRDGGAAAGARRQHLFPELLRGVRRAAGGA